MVGFLGFLILAVGGGGLAIYLGVPPILIGGYIVGLIALTALTGFSTGDDEGRSRGSGSSGGGGRGRGTLGKMADTAGSFLGSLADESSSSSSRDRSDILERMRRGSGSDYPSELQDRVVGSEPEGDSRDVAEEAAEAVDEVEEEGEEEEGETMEEIDVVESLEDDLEDDTSLDRSIEERLEELKREFAKMQQLVSEGRSDKADISRMNDLGEQMNKTEKEIYREIQELKKELNQKEELLSREEQEIESLEADQERRNREVELLEENIRRLEQMEEFLENNIQLQGRSR